MKAFFWILFAFCKVSHLFSDISQDVFSVYLGINGKYTVTHFDTTNRRYGIDPLFFFVVPRVDNFKRGTIRLTDVKLYGQALSNDDSMSLIEDFHPE